MRILTAFALLLAAWAFAPQADAQQDNDFMAPLSPEPGLVGGLRGVTLIVTNIEQTAKLYGEAFGLSLEGPVASTDDLAAQQRALWGMPGDMSWTLYIMRRTSVPEAAILRVLVVPSDTPAMRKSWDRREPGPYGIGFATEHTYALDARAIAAGFERTTPEVSDYTAERPDGSLYRIHEGSWYGPGFVRAIGVSRRDGMAPVGPIDPATGMGGPSYASQILVSLDPMIAFFEGVLDFEVRSIRDWTVFNPPFRFAMVHPKGPINGHVAFVEYESQHAAPGTGVSPSPPHVGMAIWSFPTRNLDEVMRRARAFGADVQMAPQVMAMPDLGCVRIASLRAPTGFLIEVFEPDDTCSS